MNDLRWIAPATMLISEKVVTVVKCVMAELPRPLTANTVNIDLVWAWVTGLIAELLIGERVKSIAPFCSEQSDRKGNVALDARNEFARNAVGTFVKFGTDSDDTFGSEVHTAWKPGGSVMFDERWERLVACTACASKRETAGFNGW